MEPGGWFLPGVYWKRGRGGGGLAGPPPSYGPPDPGAKGAGKKSLSRAEKRPQPPLAKKVCET